MPYLTPAQERQIDRAEMRGEASVRLEFHRDCAFCGATRAMRQDAAIATGVEIVHWDVKFVDGEWVRDESKAPYRYQPERGEVLKNHYMLCRVCGEEQGS